MGMGLGLGLRLGNVAASGGGPAGTPYSIPAYYTSTSLFPWGVIDSSGGAGTFTSTFAAANFKDAGGPFYISPTGSDATGTGAIGNPWQSISKALNTAASGSLINMAAGRYAPPATTDGSGKLMSFVASAINTVFVGNLLANADVLSWGVPVSGQQTVTLTTGVVAGFVDTTKIDPTTTVYQTSFNAATTGAITTFQGSAQGGIYRPSLSGGATPSVLGAFDSRSLTNTFDTTLLAWRAGVPTTYFAGTTGQKLYFENIVFVGEDLIELGAVTARIITNNCNYIGGDNLIGSGVSNLPTIGIRNMIAVGCKGAGAADLIDANCTAICDNVLTYNVSQGGGDSPYTSHNGPQLNINCLYSGNLTGATGRQGRQGYFGCTIGGTDTALRIGFVSPYSIDTHVKGCSFPGSPAIANVNMGSLANNAAGYIYDTTSLAGKTVAGNTMTDRSGNKPSAQQTLFYPDPSNLAFVFKDQAGTIPVTTDGDPVGCVKCSAGTGGQVSRVVATGTAIWHTDGTHSWITQTGCLWTATLAAPMAEETTIITGINSSDTTFIYFTLSSSSFVDFRATGNPYGNCSWTVSANGGFAVNAGVPSSLASIKSTACNGSNNVFTMRRADLMYTPWRIHTLFCGTTAGTNSLDGNWYGSRYVAWGSDAEIKAAEQLMGLKMGTVIP